MPLHAGPPDALRLAGEETRAACRHSRLMANGHGGIPEEAPGKASLPNHHCRLRIRPALNLRAQRPCGMDAGPALKDGDTNVADQIRWGVRRFLPLSRQPAMPTAAPTGSAWCPSAAWLPGCLEHFE